MPAAEVRGEGIFLQFREDAMQEWHAKIDVSAAENKFFGERISLAKRSPPRCPGNQYPSIRYVLLHTFAHALMRHLTLECGYTAASIRERIYAQHPDSEHAADGRHTPLHLRAR